MAGPIRAAILLALFKCIFCYEVGNMFTEFKVEQGQGKYTVPIATPKGFPTHLLELTLQYSNAGGNGPFGLGWTIGGLTQIARYEVYAANGTVHYLSCWVARTVYW